MNNTNTQSIVVMGIYPRTRGFGYVVFRGPSAPQRWGAKDIRVNKNSDNMLKIEELVLKYRPDIVVLEDYAGEGSRRAERIENLIDDIAELAVQKHIRVCRYSRSMIRECFSEFNAFTKLEVAQAIAKTLPELRPQLPAKRKIWLPEDPRMAIFDAAALVFSYFFFDKERKQAA